VLTDDQAEAIRKGLAAGVRGPVLLKWALQLLADRDAHAALDGDRAALERAISGALREAIQCSWADRFANVGRRREADSRTAQERSLRVEAPSSRKPARQRSSKVRSLLASATHASHW
jgi:hypothetical protein